MFNIDITQNERQRLVDHFTALLKTEAAKGRVVDRRLVIECLEALRLLDDSYPAATETDE